MCCPERADHKLVISQSKDKKGQKEKLINKLNKHFVFYPIQII